MTSLTAPRFLFPGCVKGESESVHGFENRGSSTGGSCSKTLRVVQIRSVVVPDYYVVNCLPENVTCNVHCLTGCRSVVVEHSMWYKCGA